jgi:DeoR/GlpR family transcriptional regulator of sugar metabolism
VQAKVLSLEERRQQILKNVDDKGRVSVAELSSMLGVSGVTIRNDLQALADQKLVIRTHGGAISNNDGLYELALAMRRQKQVQEKNRIGQACAGMIANSEAVILDSSSTALAIVKHLKDRRQLTIVTNSLAVAQELRDAPGVSVVMPGGKFQPETNSITGTGGLGFLRRFNLQKGFFGAHGVTLQEGLTDVSLEEAEIKRELAAMCRQKIAVVDASKWGQVGLASFAQVQDFDIVITDKQAPAELLEQVRTLDIEVIEV